MSWPEFRQRELTERLARLFTRVPIRFSFVPSGEVAQLRYFPEAVLLERDLADLAPEPFAFVPWRTGIERGEIDVLLVPSHGDNNAKLLWQLRQHAGPDAIVAVWFWDNHMAWSENLRTVLAADLAFVSHASAEFITYLQTPAALVCGHVPACSAQWAVSQTGQLRDCAAGTVRQHKALVNYVDYEFGWGERSRLLRSYATSLADADVLLMPRQDRTRYFKQAPLERFAEWCGYKATVIVPMRDDLSTRVFDALLAGLIPIMPAAITDLDRVIPEPVRTQLGIVVVDSLELPVVQAALAEALGRFDVMGLEGILARQGYVLENHMLVNRVTAMLYQVWQLGTGERKIEFRLGEQGPALFA